MAFLAVDVGNTQTTLGLFDASGNTAYQWRMATDATNTADELRERMFGYFTMDGLSMGDVSDAAVASVVPLLTSGWKLVLDYLASTDALVVDTTRDCGLAIAMPSSVSVGADRVANALAARNTYGAPVIVVDFGTATNIDVVDASGAFRGGVIMPGVLSGANALFAHAAKLASVPIAAPPAALGATTETAVQSGIVIGAAAAAEGLVARIAGELAAEWATGKDMTNAADDANGTAVAGTDERTIADAPRPTVVGTGGLCATIAEATDLFDAIDPDLTLRGIYQIWRHARG